MSYAEAYDALRAGEHEQLQRLLASDRGLARQRADRVDWPDADLLQHAVWWARSEAVELLVRAGADLAARGGEPPQSALERALELGRDGLARHLGPAQDAASAAGRERV